MREIRPLTTLRALAALLVFLYHYAVLHAPDGGAGVPLRAVWAHGYMGVPIFFVLSGFLITRLYFDGLREHTVSLREFLLKRVARIWPLFLVLAVVQHGMLWWQGRIEPSPDWLVTLSMSQGWFAELVFRGLVPAWSLTIEETFYVLVPVFCLVVDRYVFRGDSIARATPRLTLRRWAALVVVLMLMAAGMAAVGEVGWRLTTGLDLDWRGFLDSREHMMRLTLFGRFPEFAVGMAAAFVHRDGRLLAWLGPARAGWLSLAFLVGIGALLRVKDAAPPGVQYLVHNAVALGAGALILTLSVAGHRPGKLLGWPPLVYLGRISYGFYLIQLSVLSEPLTDLTGRCGPWRLPVHFLLAVAVCSLLYEAVERPARRAIVARWVGSTGISRHLERPGRAS